MLACRVADRTKAVAALNNAHSQALGCRLRGGSGDANTFIETELSDLERQFIERRLEEDKSAMERLASSTFPRSFKIPYE